MRNFFGGSKPALAGLQVQFWDDSRYCDLDPQTCQEIERQLSSGKVQYQCRGQPYELVNAPLLASGGAFQRNVKTGMQRHARIKVVSAGPAPTGVFEFFNDRTWQAYDRALQAELFATVQHGGSQLKYRHNASQYWIEDLELACVGAARQVNEQTRWARPVRFVSPPARFASPVPGAGVEPRAPPLIEVWLKDWTPYDPRGQQQVQAAMQEVQKGRPNGHRVNVNGLEYVLQGLDAFERTGFALQANPSDPAGKTRPIRLQPHRGPQPALPAAAHGSQQLSGRGMSLRGSKRTSSGAGSGMLSLPEDAESSVVSARAISVCIQAGDPMDVDPPLGASVPPPPAGMPLASNAAFTNAPLGNLPVDTAATNAIPAVSGVGYPTDDSRGRELLGTTCDICGDEIDEVLRLPCGHAFHAECIERWFESKPRCMTCNTLHGVMIGRQPDGVMEWQHTPDTCAGYPPGAIRIQFAFPEGRDADGKRYFPRREHAWLPASPQGEELLRLFQRAFRRRVMFGLGDSMSSGKYKPTFNVHIKTRLEGGAVRHGWPDPGYFARALDELEANGISRSLAMTPVVPGRVLAGPPSPTGRTGGGV